MGAGLLLALRNGSEGHRALTVFGIFISERQLWTTLVFSVLSGAYKGIVVDGGYGTRKQPT